MKTYLRKTLDQFNKTRINKRLSAGNNQKNLSVSLSHSFPVDNPFLRAKVDIPLAVFIPLAVKKTIRTPIITIVRNVPGKPHLGDYRLFHLKIILPRFVNITLLPAPVDNVAGK
jgi:hypothetical protein